MPTEPEALRLAIEHRRSSGSPLDPSPAHSPRGGEAVERLLEILSEPIAWTRGGFGQRFIFDSRTARILAEAEVIFDAQAAGYPGVPNGTVFRETAFLESGIVARNDA